MRGVFGGVFGGVFEGVGTLAQGRCMRATRTAPLSGATSYALSMARSNRSGCATRSVARGRSDTLLQLLQHIAATAATHCCNGCSMLLASTIIAVLSGPRGGAAD